MSKKVTVEVTDKGWTTTVQLGEKVFTEKHVNTPTGSRSVGEVIDREQLPEVLADALEGFFAYDVMNALRRVRLLNPWPKDDEEEEQYQERGITISHE